MCDGSPAEERTVPGAAPQCVHACADGHFHSHLNVLVGAVSGADLIYMSSLRKCKEQGRRGKKERMWNSEETG